MPQKNRSGLQKGQKRPQKLAPGALPPRAADPNVTVRVPSMLKALGPVRKDRV